MSYNTERTKLIMKEYGRNIQSLVEYAVTLEDDQKRNELAHAIIELMGQMNPSLRNIEDFRHKLWDHLFIMSDFKINVDSPYPLPDKEVLFSKPERIHYPKTDCRFKHYGINVERLVEKAISMEDEEKQKAFAIVIASYMKLVYNNWNREKVSDEIIKEDLRILSDNKLDLQEDDNLDFLSRPPARKRKNKQSSGRRDGSRSRGQRRK